ncbi:formin-binding protein 4-like [Bolinopsis microptera]|uniref:formin-binding protein 4-like n=1 Tax=Bolinopsis microptera TaxID=2820187 RepID=UPI0030794E3F
MPKSQKKSKKSKEPKHKPQTQQSFDEIEESLLLGEDDLFTEPVNHAKTRKNSLESSLLEEELLGESPVVVKKSKRRKTKNSVSVSKTDKISISELEISLTTSERDDSISESLLMSPTFIESPDKSVSDNVENIAQVKNRKPTKKIKVMGKIDFTNIEKEIQLSEPEVILEKVESPVKPVKVSALEPLQMVRNLDVEEVDIYSDLSTDNIDSHTPEGGEEVTLDEVFKMNKKSPEKAVKKAEVKQDILSENEDEDLDYEAEDEKEISQMKISVLVGGSKEKKSQKPSVDKKTLPTLPQISAPVILPPLPHTCTHITIPPMLPLPPVLPQPPRYPPPAYAPSHIKERRMIYINPKFRTEVILKNLEEQGIIKGGTMAVHMNRHRIRSRSRSPIKLHTNFEYVPSPKHKQRLELDDPTTTLLITDLSVCTTKSRIRELFSSVGNVKEVLTYPAERRAVVTFEHAKDAVICRRKFHRSVVDGSCMTVNFAI